MKRINALAIVLSSIVFMLVSCGGGGSSSTNTNSTSPSPTSSTKVIDLGNATRFTIPPDAISFLVSAVGDTGSRLGFNSLITPNGDDLINGDLAGFIYGKKGMEMYWCP